MEKRSTLPRRRFLGALAAASLAGGRHAPGAAKSGARVIVIGAGVSGLAAASKLHEAGLKVTVLEGRERIGGRIHTDRATFGVPVEIGAQYVQGIKDSGGELSPAWAMAKEHGWASVPFSSEEVQVVREGEEVDADKLSALMDDFRAAVEEGEDEIELKHSVEDAVRRYVEEEELDSREAAELRAMVASEVGLEYGGDVSEIAIQSIGDEDGFAGGNQILTGGYDQVPALLAAGLDVRLGEVVTAVDHSGPVCTVTTKKGGTHQADYVLCTLPLGVLKAGSVHFSPALPAEKTAAIARMGMSCLGKVFLEFPKRFWPEDVNWFLSLKKAAPWGVAFSSLSRVIPGRHILIFWHSGTRALEREAMTDDAVVQIALDELRHATGEDIPAPLKVKVTRWGSDPFSRGAYFFPKVNSPMTDVAALAAPVGKRLFFAGEATEAGLFGTVPGAIMSGWREAEKILDLAEA